MLPTSPLTGASRGVRIALTALIALAIACAGAFAIASTGLGPAGAGEIITTWGSTATQGLVLAIVCLRLVVVRSERLAWSMLAGALAAWIAGDILWHAAGYPTVSVADVLYGISYACFYANLGLLLRRRARGLGVSAWLDGIVGATCMIALSGTFVLPAIAGSGGSTLETVVNLFYPVADLVLVVLAVGGMALSRWHASPAWIALAVGQTVSGVVDSLYLYGVAAHPVVPSWVLFSVWNASFIVLGVAAWLPTAIRGGRAEGARLLIAPAVFAVIATAVLAVASIHGSRSVGLAFAALTVAGVLIRMTLFYREISMLHDGLARAEREAARDPLTGLLNHRTFHERLAEEVTRAHADGTTLSLVLLDLDHFKLVNDTRGHQAGDALLVRVAQRLQETARTHDVLGRVGGEEFAWILPHCTEMEAVEAADRARVAIHGLAIEVEGLRATTLSAGVSSTDRASSPVDIYRLADGALYWAKAHGRDKVVSYSPEVVTALSASDEAAQLARSQALSAVNVLARAVDAKDPYTQRHSERVADLSIAIATALGWQIPEIVALRTAALVHDVGKIGVPDAVLAKHEHLDEEEWRVIRAHPGLGAQIVSGVLSADQVSWVRGHHERHDGGGYPDGLAGEDVPLGASVLAVADAWDAMTSDRPYRPALSIDEALRRCHEGRGTQFRPEVIEALDRLAEAGALDQRFGGAAGSETPRPHVPAEPVPA